MSVEVTVMKTTDELQGSGPRPKALYEPPQLRCYGNLRELTTSGSGQVSESATGDPGMCGPTYKPTPGVMCL